MTAAWWVRPWVSTPPMTTRVRLAILCLPFLFGTRARAGRAGRQASDGLGQQARIRSRRPSGRVHDHDGSDGAPTDPTHDTSGSANLGVRPTAATRAHPDRTSRTASSLPTSVGDR